VTCTHWSDLQQLRTREKADTTDRDRKEQINMDGWMDG